MFITAWVLICCVVGGVVWAINYHKALDQVQKLKEQNEVLTDYIKYQTRELGELHNFVQCSNARGVLSSMINAGHQFNRADFRLGSLDENSEQYLRVERICEEKRNEFIGYKEKLEGVIDTLAMRIINFYDNNKDYAPIGKNHS